MPTRTSATHAEVQYATTGGVGARTLAYGAALTVGRLLVVTVVTDRSATVTVSDGTNGAYTQSGSYVSSRISQWHFPNNASAATPTVSVTPSVDCALSISVDEYSGVAAASAVRATAVNTGSGTTAGTGGVVGAFPGDLVVMSFDLFAPAVTVAAVTPNTGVSGAAVTITGSNFGITQGASTVRFNGVLAVVDAWTSASIAVHVPVGATTGPVVVRVNEQDSPGVTFTVTGGEVYDYYVSVSGNNGWSGTSPTFVSGTTGPWATVQYALERASALLAGAGKTIAVLGGTHTTAVIEPVAAGTSWINKLRVVNYQGQNVTIAPTSGPHAVSFAGAAQYIELEGLNLDGSLCDSDAVRIYNISAVHHATHIRIQGLPGVRPTITSTTTSPNHVQHVQVAGDPAWAPASLCEFRHLRLTGGGNTDFDNGFYIQCDGNLIEWCDVDDIYGAAVQIYLTGGSPSSNTVRYNLLRNLTRTSYRCDGVIVYGNNNALYGNLIYNLQPDPTGGSASGHIYILGGSGNQVLNNTCAKGTDGITGIKDEGSNTVVRNNICYGNPINYSGPGGANATNNLFGGADPFTNYAGNDFTIGAASPARNTGADTSALVTVDLAGTSRPRATMDIGAYEYPE